MKQSRFTDSHFLPYLKYLFLFFCMQSLCFNHSCSVSSTVYFLLKHVVTSFVRWIGTSFFKFYFCSKWSSWPSCGLTNARPWEEIISLNSWSKMAPLFLFGVTIVSLPLFLFLFSSAVTSSLLFLLLHDKKERNNLSPLSLTHLFYPLLLVCLLVQFLPTLRWSLHADFTRF